MLALAVGGVATAQATSYQEGVVETALRQLGRDVFLDQSDCSTGCYQEGSTFFVPPGVRPDCCLAAQAITSTGPQRREGGYVLARDAPLLESNSYFCFYHIG